MFINVEDVLFVNFVDYYVIVDKYDVILMVIIVEKWGKIVLLNYEKLINILIFIDNILGCVFKGNVKDNFEVI